MSFYKRSNFLWSIMIDSLFRHLHVYFSKIWGGHSSDKQYIHFTTDYIFNQQIGNAGSNRHPFITDWDKRLSIKAFLAQHLLLKWNFGCFCNVGTSLKTKNKLIRIFIQWYILFENGFYRRDFLHINFNIRTSKFKDLILGL